MLIDVNVMESKSSCSCDAVVVLNHATRPPCYGRPDPFAWSGRPFADAVTEALLEGQLGGWAAAADHPVYGDYSLWVFEPQVQSRSPRKRARPTQ